MFLSHCCVLVFLDFLFKLNATSSNFPEFIDVCGIDVYTSRFSYHWTGVHNMVDSLIGGLTQSAGWVVAIHFRTPRRSTVWVRIWKIFLAYLGVSAVTYVCGSRLLYGRRFSEYFRPSASTCRSLSALADTTLFTYFFQTSFDSKGKYSGRIRPPEGGGNK